MLPLGLRLYRLLNAEPAAQAPAIPRAVQRPPGRLVWLHAPRSGAARSLLPVLQALLDEGLANAVLVTCPGLAACPGALTAAVPQDAPDAVAGFLDHWRPDVGVWFDGALRPVMLHALADRGVPMMLVDGRAPDLPGARWWPRVLSGLMAPFRHVLVVDEDAARAFQRLGADPARVQVTGPLEEPSHVLPATEAERAAMARTIGTRPVWLAVGVPESEDDAVAAAHLVALRLAHRLLLILVPDQPGRAAALADRLRGQFGLDTVLRSSEADPAEDAQVYVADTEGELGLWYRLAPVTYLGGTLSGPGPLRPPFEAAAMGSALIHGLALGPEAPAFDRLRQAGASRVVPGAADLGEAVGDLLAADRCARLAQAAWGVASAGVEATALAVQLAGAILDEAEARRT
jgi:3-deoxy-D-manno-octulosonic-acid transferase